MSKIANHLHCYRWLSFLLTFFVCYSLKNIICKNVSSLVSSSIYIIFNFFFHSFFIIYQVTEPQGRNILNSTFSFFFYFFSYLLFFSNFWLDVDLAPCRLSHSLSFFRYFFALTLLLIYGVKFTVINHIIGYVCVSMYSLVGKKHSMVGVGVWVRICRCKYFAMQFVIDKSI